MTKHKSNGDQVTKANQRISRPGESEAEQKKSAARLLRADMLPAAAGAITQAADRPGETEEALRRATAKRKGEGG